MLTFMTPIDTLLSRFISSVTLNWYFLMRNVLIHRSKTHKKFIRKLKFVQIIFPGGYTEESSHRIEF